MAKGRPARVENTSDPPIIDAALLEKWALFYLERYASSAENLRRVLQRRVWRRAGRDSDASRDIAPLIDALVARYRAAGLLDDEAYAAARARSGLGRGHSPRRIAAGLAAKGVASGDITSALDALRESVPQPELAAALAFARRRRLGPYRTRPVTQGDQRELAAFARGGFSRSTAQAVLACRDATEAAALLAIDEA
ncbi:MAG: RecX family transcriptional regulator [Alphaproteobacteria bacterium]|nr:RecX family transcriptional regulator [Alphaproteobacteria bacterium]